MIFIWLGVGILLGWLGIQWIGHRLTYPRDRVFTQGPEDTDLTVEEIEFCAEDGTALHGWWFPKEQSRGVILVCHGNAGNISNRLWIAEDLRDVPADLFIFDYRGYGKSKGIPSERGTALDVVAAYEVARSRLGIQDNPPIVVYGRSLGGAVALQLASAIPLRGVILESTFSSIVEVGTYLYPGLLPKLTCRHPYRSIDRIPLVSCPVLAAHSPDDETVPFAFGKKCYDMAPDLWRFCTLTGSHVDAGWQSSPEYAESFREFIELTLP